MSLIKKMMVAASVALAGAGLGATSASAYAISGGAYTGTATAAHTFTFAGAYVLTCPASSVSYAGSATGSASSNFTPAFGSGCTFFGLPALVTQNGQWIDTVTSGPVAGVFGADFHIPAGSTTTIEIPAIGCAVTISGTQSFANGVGGNSTTTTNVLGGVNARVRVGGLAYSASGCPFGSAANGVYDSNGSVTIPGITVS